MIICRRTTLNWNDYSTTNQPFIRTNLQTRWWLNVLWWNYCNFYWCLFFGITHKFATSSSTRSIETYWTMLRTLILLFFWTLILQSTALMCSKVCCLATGLNIWWSFSVELWELPPWNLWTQSSILILTILCQFYGVPRIICYSRSTHIFFYDIEYPEIM